MSGIFGLLGLDDNERAFVQNVGQGLVFNAVVDLVAEYNAELNASLGVFVETETELFTERYKSQGGGRLQKVGEHGRPGDVKASGSYDVSYPLEEAGASLGSTRRGMAYMTMQELDNHLDTILLQDANTVRFELLQRLFKNTTNTFVDPINGSLTIQPLANGDAVTYPPVLGSESEATENHYLESGYTAANISDSNNPYQTIVDELEEHFGAVQGNSSIICFINNAQRSKTEDLTDYDPVNDRFTSPGDDTDTLFGLPAGMPGRVLGRTNGVWVVEYRWIPSGYILAVDPTSNPPLKMRVDPADTGLPRGLNLVGGEHEHTPLKDSVWMHAWGFGAGNRLNGVAMELGTGGTYTIPTAYQ